MESRGEQPCPDVLAPAQEQVDRLESGMGGVWLVCTRKATTHLWDLDKMTYQRQPGPGSSPMAYDDTTVPITNVGAWPEVGGRALVFFDDPESPFMEQWRLCSAIRSITRVSAPDVNARTAPRATDASCDDARRLTQPVPSVRDATTTDG